MTDVSLPRMARGKTLTAGLVVAAILASLLFASIASAASDPVGSGNAKLTFTRGISRTLLNKHVRLQRIKPTNVKLRTLTFKLNGGSIDPTNGKGNVKLAGGFKFRHRKRAVAVRGLALNTTKRALNGVVGGKRMKVATILGFSQARNGFGVNLTVKRLKLTGAAARRLNAKLGLKEKGDRAFRGGQVMGAAKSNVQPLTLNVQAGGSASLLTDQTTVEKFLGLGVSINPVEPTTETKTPLPKFDFPVSGGTVSPTAQVGIIDTSGGITLEGPEIEPSPTEAPGQKTKFSIELANIDLDLGTNTATVEVVVKSSNPIFNEAVHAGSLGRTSIADVSLASSTITADGNAHTVTVTNATATLQPLTAAVLNEIFAGKMEVFKGGDSLGLFSFSVSTE